MKKLILLLTLTIALNAQAQSTTSYHIFIDLTEETLVENYKKEITNRLLKIANRSSVKDGNGIIVTFYPITNLAGVKTRKIVLPAREIAWYDNELIRQDEINNFIKLIPVQLKKFQFGDGYGYTRIYENLIQEVNTKSNVIVLTDLIENSDIGSLYSSYPGLEIANSFVQLNIDNIEFIRGISDSSDQSLVRLGDYAEKFWAKVIPNVEITNLQF